MRTITLVRIGHTPFATYGQLSDETNTQIGVTLERPWLDNAADESCVPVGTYAAHRFRSPKRGYDVFVLTGVPDRDAIELHIGNVPGDSHGCILIGSNFGVVNGQRGITGSAAAFARFMAMMAGVDAFTLVIAEGLP